MTKKGAPIKYTSRDYESIRNDLIEYARRYYSDIYKDFNEASFGSMTLDNISYIGDILSFYLDYQASEAFAESAIEYDNVIRHARVNGYKLNTNPSSHGVQSFYILIPANASGLGPDPSYMPVLRRGSEVGSAGKTFLLVEDIDFRNSNTDVVAARISEDTGVPTYYAVKARGQIISGELQIKRVPIDSFQKFLRVDVGSELVAEIISVTDSEGHEYYEVEHLSQDVVFRSILNTNEDKDDVPNIMKPFPVPRRFTVERLNGRTYLQFGYGSDAETTSASVVDPANISLDVFGKDYITDSSFDPSNIVSTDKFGIAPSNTTLTITYRRNTDSNVNAAPGTVNEVIRPIFKFTNRASLDDSEIAFIVNSLETGNETRISGDISIPDSEELKILAQNYFATQKRAVTEKDYKAIAYAMPNKFGAIKRVSVTKDVNSFKRNLNLYLVAENADGNLTEANATLKRNLKTWLNRHKMENDTIDILDAFIVNFGIEFKIVAERERNKYEVLSNAISTLRQDFLVHYEIGEPILIGSIYNTLNEADGVEDVTDVRITRKTGGEYSTTSFNFDDNLSPDGRMIRGYKNIVYELKFPADDIVGTVV
jgi:hypothetical protein